MNQALLLIEIRHDDFPGSGLVRAT